MDYLRTIWDQLTSFCTCLSCAEDLNNPGYEPSERTHLLTADPSNQSPAIIRRTNSEQFSHEISQSLPKKDDQNALCLLVQNTAIQMIDVGAMDAHNLEHQEYDDRMKLYSQRLQQQWSNIQNPNKQSSFLLRDMPAPEIYLVKQVDVEDIMQMRSVLGKTHSALCEIRVEHKDPIVVPFQIM